MNSLIYSLKLIVLFVFTMDELPMTSIAVITSLVHPLNTQKGTGAPLLHEWSSTGPYCVDVVTVLSSALK